MDASEPTITLTRKQLLALGLSEATLSGLPFSNTQSNAQSNEPAQSAACVSPPIKKLKREPEDQSTEVKLNDLPLLPFEKILSYLSLEDRVRSRIVSRKWRDWIDSCKVNSLFYSECKKDYILGNRRLINGRFAQNFIHSPSLQPFFNVFGQSILSNLKKLHMCWIDHSVQDGATAFASIVNSFEKLEELGLFHSGPNPIPSGYEFNPIKLNLPNLNRITFEDLEAIKLMTLYAPRLQTVKLAYCENLNLQFAHAESVETLLIDDWNYTRVKKMKNLKHLRYSGSKSKIDKTFLSALKQLKEIHLINRTDINKIFSQKQSNGRADLKVYLCGLLLDGPDDPANNSGVENLEFFVYLTENPTKLADEFLNVFEVYYTGIEKVSQGEELNVLRRFIDCDTIVVSRPVKDLQRFFDTIKDLNKISTLGFQCEQQQQLFDQLPEHCAIQRLIISCETSDFGFLYKLTELVYIYLFCAIDVQVVRRVFEELAFVLLFQFRRANKMIKIEINPGVKQFEVTIGTKTRTASDLNAAIQFVIGNASPKKRRTGEASTSSMGQN